MAEKAPALNLRALAIADIRGGHGMAPMVSLARVLSAPAMGPNGQIITQEGVTEIGKGTIVETALGALKGRIKVPDDSLLRDPIGERKL